MSARTEFTPVQAAEVYRQLVEGVSSRDVASWLLRKHEKVVSHSAILTVARQLRAEQEQDDAAFDPPGAPRADAEQLDGIIRRLQRLEALARRQKPDDLKRTQIAMKALSCQIQAMRLKLACAAKEATRAGARRRLAALDERPDTLPTTLPDTLPTTLPEVAICDEIAEIKAETNPSNNPSNNPSSAPPDEVAILDALAANQVTPAVEKEIAYSILRLWGEDPDVSDAPWRLVNQYFEENEKDKMTPALKALFAMRRAEADTEHLKSKVEQLTAILASSSTRPGAGESTATARPRPTEATAPSRPVQQAERTPPKPVFLQPPWEKR